MKNSVYICRVNDTNMIYTVSEYRDKFHPSKSIRTVQRMLQSGLMPSNHHIKKGHDTMIFVGSEHEYKASEYFESATEYHRLKQSERDYQTATRLAIESGLSVTKFYKMLGL